MSGWLLWLSGAAFTRGIIRVTAPARNWVEAVAGLVLALVAWPYLLLTWLGALTGVWLVKAGVK